MDLGTDRTRLFPERLAEAIATSGLTRSAFARRAGIDRTTLAQLLSPSSGRLPRMDTIVAIAAAHDLSIDWLVGLSNTGPVEAELVVQSMTFEAPGPTPTDERLLGWLTEAADYKIRYVPTTVPDLLKTDELIRFERQRTATLDVAQTTIATTAARLAWARHPDTDMECCSPTQSLTAFARGEGVWSRLPAAVRAAQLDRMIELVDELYPTFRWFLFDGAKRFAAPVTIFGSQRAALYLGQLYLVLTGIDHVRALSHHFDTLIRDAEHQPHTMQRHLTRLRDRIGR